MDLCELKEKIEINVNEIIIFCIIMDYKIF